MRRANRKKIKIRILKLLLALLQTTKKSKGMDMGTDIVMVNHLKKSKNRKNRIKKLEM
jgi:hypothetical protein